MVSKTAIQCLITLVIFGAVGADFNQLTDDQKAVTICIQNSLAALPRYKIFGKLSPAAFLTVYATILNEGSMRHFLKEIKKEEKDSPQKINENLTQSIRQDCPELEGVFTSLANEGNKVLQTDERFSDYIELNKEGKYEFLYLGRIVLGLLKSAKYLTITVRSDTDIRYDASICLTNFVREKLLPEPRKREEVIAVLNEYCAKPSLSDFTLKRDEENVAAKTVKQCLNQGHRSYLYLYDIYKSYGMERIARSNQPFGRPKAIPKYADYSLFAYGICDTANWASFKSIQDDVERFYRFQCLLGSAELFIDEGVKPFVQDELRNNDIYELESYPFWLNIDGEFRLACEKAGAFTVEEITREGVNGVLEKYNQIYFEIILNIWKEISEEKQENIANADIQHDTDVNMQDASDADMQDGTINKNGSVQHNMEEKEAKNRFNIMRKKFIDEVFGHYKMDAKWRCFTQERDEIPFYDWVEKYSLFSKPPETVMSFFRKFKNEIKESLPVGELYKKVQKEIREDIEKGTAIKPME